MVGIKNREKVNSTGWCPSQSTESPRQVSQLGVLIPVKLQDWRCRCSYSRGKSDCGFAWSYTIGMMLSNERLRLNMRW